MLATSAFIMRRTSPTIVCNAGANSGREFFEVASENEVIKSFSWRLCDQKIESSNDFFSTRKSGLGQGYQRSLINAKSSCASLGAPRIEVCGNVARHDDSHDLNSRRKTYSP